MYYQQIDSFKQSSEAYAKYSIVYEAQAEYSKEYEAYAKNPKVLNQEIKLESSKKLLERTQQSLNSSAKHEYIA